MGTEQVNGKREGVTLLRPGIGTETMVLTEGSTLADLLRQAGVKPSNSSIFIDRWKRVGGALGPEERHGHHGRAPGQKCSEPVLARLDGRLS